MRRVNLRIDHEATFAPVKCIVRVKYTDEAIVCAHDNEYGLSAWDPASRRSSLMLSLDVAQS